MASFKEKIFRPPGRGLLGYVSAGQAVFWLGFASIEQGYDRLSSLLVGLSFTLLALAELLPISARAAGLVRILALVLGVPVLWAMLRAADVL